MSDFNTIMEIFRWLSTGGEVEFNIGKEKWVLHMENNGQIRDDRSEIWGIEGLRAQDFYKIVER